MAKVVIPTLTSFEKSGSFINRSFCLQAFQQAVPGPAGLLPDLSILARFINELLDGVEQDSDLDQIREEMTRLPASPLKGLSFSALKKEVIQLDGLKWADLPFVEGKALHYEPAGVGAGK